MPRLQSIINFVALILAATSLYYISGEIKRQQHPIGAAIDLTDRIARGYSLQESEIAKLKTLLSEAKVEDYQQSPLCFLKAYEQIAVKQQISSANLFLLFEQSRHEYDNIKRCSHYYSVLIQRANALQITEKDKILNILANLQKERYNLQYSKGADKQNSICVYFYTHNSQAHIKEQIKRLTTQKYSNFNIIVQDDGSQDSSHIITKYTVDQMPLQLRQKINVAHNIDKIGFLIHFEELLKDKCQQSSIVLLLDSSELLISQNSFDLLNRVFSEQTINIAFFKSLTTRHLNAEDNQIIASGKIKAVVAPVLAFRKSKYVEVLSELKEKTKGGDYLGIQREVLSYYLLKNETKPSAIKVIDEIFVERNENKDFMLQQRVQNLINGIFEF